ncbi:MAG: Npt1/Npt2 family nucleotide transporter [Rickettsiaceae bacterium]
MLHSKTKNFYRLLVEILWPVQKHEMKLFIAVALMMFCMLSSFGMLRSLKDGLIIPEIGAEVISFLKFCFVLPFSIVFTILYIKLSNNFQFNTVFYIIIFCFLLFFVLFAYAIYPNEELFHIQPELISYYANKYPYFQWMIKIIGKWSYVLMYLFAELWSVVVINLMFWQFANHIFNTQQARRFYPMLGFLGNIGLIFAGNTLIASSKLPLEYLEYQLECYAIFQKLIILIVGLGLASIALFYYINKCVMKDDYFRQHFTRAQEETKTKLSIVESFKLIVHSKYIRNIVLLVLCYGFVINILEGPWKSKVSIYYANTIDYVHFMGRFNVWMGISCICFTIIGSNLVRRCQWIVPALVTPSVICTTGSMFFIFIVFNDRIKYFVNFSFDPIYLAVLVGALQNILSKSFKYSLFDSTKEMAYIPLSIELRTKGKVTAEVLGMKFGKSFSAFIQLFMFSILPGATFDSIVPYLMVIFIIMMVVWFKSIIKLNQEYSKIQKQGVN